MPSPVFIIIQLELSRYVDGTRPTTTDTVIRIFDMKKFNETIGVKLRANRCPLSVLEQIYISAHNHSCYLAPIVDQKH